MKNKKIVLRNGDWAFFPIDNKEFKGELIKHDTQFTFAEGEATNHFHTIHVPKVEDMELIKLVDGSYLVNFKSEARITHPEHSMKKDLVIPIGTYKLTQRREKDWFQLTTRKIVD